MIGRYLLAWLPMVVLAILNGVAREATYGRVLSEQAAHQLSTVTLILAFGVYIWLLSGRWPLPSLGQAWAVGAAWLMLTVAFEFAMGRFVGLSWEQMLQAYDILAGNLWLLVPVTVAVLPALAYGLRSRTA
jgi:hypothetical protein